MNQKPSMLLHSEGHMTYINQEILSNTKKQDRTGVISVTTE